MCTCLNFNNFYFFNFFCTCRKNRYTIQLNKYYEQEKQQFIMNQYMSSELVTLYTLTPEVTLKQCFKTTLFLYDETEDPFLLVLRYIMYKSPDFSFMYWIKEILCTTFESNKVFHVTFPSNACLIMKQTIPIIILEAYKELMVPELNMWNRLPVPDFDLSVPFVMTGDDDFFSDAPNTHVYVQRPSVNIIMF